MKIFGFEFGKRKRNKVAVSFGTPPEKKEDKTTTAPKKTILIAKIPRIKNPVLSFKLRPGAKDFEQPEYDMAEIGRIEDVESYVQRAFTQKEGLMFKEDWEVVGRNLQTIKYIRQRFEQLSAATGAPCSAVFRGAGEDLIRYSNAYIVKVRDKKASGGKLRKIVGKEKPIEPVAGYFAMPVSTVRFKRDESGKILKYRQLLPNGRYKDFNPENVIHLFFRKKKGFLVGTPSLIPVKDDIRALRRIEENIEMLIYQHLFPLYHYKVGEIDAPAREYADGTREIDVVKQEIELMPAEGMMVTPERHEITAIGAEGRALRAEGYLSHFKQRIFAGLGVSAIDMGEGDCYDEQTETLTENGWKLHSDIDSRNEKIATYNPETKRIEFHIANYKYEGHYTGDMITFKGKHLDIKVTPHHQMWVAPKTGKNLQWKKVDAADLYNGLYSEFYLMESALFDWADPVGHDDPISAGYEEEITLRACPRKKGRAKDITLNTVLFAELLGYYLSEGCLDKYNAKCGRYRTILSQNKGKVLDSMVSLVERMGLPFSIIHRNNRLRESGIRIYGRALYKFIENNCPGLAGEKFIPECVWFWGQSARRELLGALVSGDGSVDTRDGRTSRVYYTSSERLADDVQILAMSLGYAAKVTETLQSEEGYSSEDTIYRVLISEQKDKQIIRIVNKSMVSKEQYNGAIYCFNVPNHLFVTRRNGRVTIQGNTANRSTADSMSRNMVDDVKHFQRIWEMFINEYVIKELLLESTFTNPVDDENLVFLRFNEIDVEARIKVENEAINAFSGHAITHSEMRRVFGKEPFSDEEWLDSYWKLIEEPKIMMQSVDEPYSAEAQALARANSAAVEQGDFDKENAERKKEVEADRKAKSAGKPGPASTKKTSGQRAAKAATTPSNQHGKKTSPEKRKSSVWWSDMIAPGNKVTELYMDLREDTVHSLETDTFDVDWFKQLALATSTMMQDRLLRLVRIDFRNSFRSTRAQLDPEDLAMPFAVFESRIQRIINRFMAVLVSRIDNGFNQSDTPDAKKIKLISIFDALKFRSRFIYNSERNKARNYGKMRGLAKLGQTEVEIVNGEDPCEICQGLAGKMNIENATIDDIPGFHSNCTCTVVRVKSQEN
jgi:hypothetical protein